MKLKWEFHSNSRQKQNIYFITLLCISLNCVWFCQHEMFDMPQIGIPKRFQYLSWIPPKKKKTNKTNKTVFVKSKVVATG